MSFLGDIVSSIGGDKAPAPPTKPPSRPSSAKPQLATPVASTGNPAAKPVYKGTVGTPAQSAGNGLKRKADEALTSDTIKTKRPSPQATPSNLDVKPNHLKPPNEEVQSPPSPNAARPPAKLPTKGSYAEIMARAKEAQTSKAPSQIGMIKHQTKEKQKTSKLADRRREEQNKQKSDKSRPDSKSGPSDKADPRRRSASPTKKTDQPKAAKSARPPLHGPPSQYKGTMGTASKRPRDERRRTNSRRDEYLGTDEEDEGDYDDSDDGGGYYSDASSDDMEGGFDDIEEEESKALRAARDDDAKELALEQRLKKEKLDRKQKLQAMASKMKK